jgi:hypothetical protein
MQNDGRVLPNLAETVVLQRLGLIRTDELPMVAARWLAADIVDTESIRLRAGHDPHDPWELERLLVEATDEVGVTSKGSGRRGEHRSRLGHKQLA